NSGEYGFEVFLLCDCSIMGNSPKVLPSGKPGAVHCNARTPARNAFNIGSAQKILHRSAGVS
ncbi:MAG: hypothetical protein KBT62_04705, partial [Sulfitobacter litoralis]|uniref:hypothetical protein n=2 Tax=Roseobacteraceae TaxID=2854170 RepID=UPI001B6EB43A